MGGSEVYSVLISTNITNDCGYEINGIFAEYLLSDVGPYNDGFGGPGGLFKWNSTIKDWMPLFQATEQKEITGGGYIKQSPGEEVQFCYYQGKVVLSALGNPEKMLLVFQVLETTKIKAPQNGFAYIDIKNQLGAALFVDKQMDVPPHPGTAYPYPEPQGWVIKLDENATATLVLKNYGNQSIDVSAQLNLPPGISILSGGSFWNVTITPSEKKELNTLIGGDEFGVYQFHTSFACDGSESFQLTQKIAIVPKVEVYLDAPEEVFFMQPYEVNLTITNIDAIPATTTLVPALGSAGNPISLTLNSSFTITISPVVMIKGANVAYDAKFQDILLARSIDSVNVHYPQIEIAGVTINSTSYHHGYFKMYSDEIYEMEIKLHNSENISYTVTLTLETDFGKSIATSEYFLADKSSESITLGPKSNGTSVFRILPLKADNLPYRELTLLVAVGRHMCSMYEIWLEVILRTPPLYSPFLTPQAIVSLVVAFAIGIACGIFIFYKLRSPQARQAYT